MYVLGPGRNGAPNMRGMPPGPYPYPHPAQMAYGMFWDEDGNPIPYGPMMMAMRPPRGPYAHSPNGGSPTDMGPPQVYTRIWTCIVLCCESYGIAS